MGVVKLATILSSIYRCQEHDIEIASLYLQGSSNPTVKCGLSEKDVKKRIKVMDILIGFHIEPTHYEFIELSNVLVVPSKTVILCWRALIEAGFKPGQRATRPFQPVPTCKVRPKDIKTCSRLAYLNLEL